MRPPRLEPGRLLAHPIDAAWVAALNTQPEQAERLGVVADVTHWLEARQLRNRLIHE